MMVKGYCTNCNKHDESRRIFDVNSEAKYCHCPHCGKKYRPRVAITNYDRVIHRYLRRAYYYLKNVRDPNAAYALFAYVLELEPGNKTAKLGRLLSLCFLSTLRRNRFIETKELLLMSNEEFRTPDIRRDYAAFLIHLDRCTNECLQRIRKKITLKGYFYDTECVKLYLKHICDAIELKRTIIEEFSFINEERLASEVDESRKACEKVYDESFFTVDGQEHRLANFAKSGDPLVVNGKKKEDTSKLQRYRMASLNPENKKQRLLKDNVFPLAYQRLFRVVSVSIALAIIFGLFAIAGLVFYLIFMKQAFALAILILMIFFGVLMLTIIGLRLLFISILKKPRI